LRAIAYRNVLSQGNVSMSRRRFRPLVACSAFTILLAMVAVDVADARGRISIGSRGTRTHTAPPATTTAPAARPIERTTTQPANPSATVGARQVTNPPVSSSAPRPGFTGGLLGAGLFGLVLGRGLTGDLGSLASFLGLALQVAILATIGWLVLGMLQGRGSAPAPARPAQPQTSAPRSEFGRRSIAPR
jgi:predicted lipid-binding transport protein (Tim44 family)